jgi:hypothetical protein
VELVDPLGFFASSAAMAKAPRPSAATSAVSFIVFILLVVWVEEMTFVALRCFPTAIAVPPGIHWKFNRSAARTTVPILHFATPVHFLATERNMMIVTSIG